MQVNQIVKGKTAGTFMILAFRMVGGEEGVQVKAVNPENHKELGNGEFWLPLDSIAN